MSRGVQMESPCGMCGRRHYLASLIDHPDQPGVLLCPIWARGHGVRPLTAAEYATAAALLGSLGGGA